MMTDARLAELADELSIFLIPALLSEPSAADLARKELAEALRYAVSVLSEVRAENARLKNEAVVRENAAAARRTVGGEG